MSDYRRAYVPGGSFFFTVVTERRAPIFRAETARSFLGTALRDCHRNWPFRLDALVLLDEHCYAIWTLPEGDTRYSARWGFIKKEFTKAWLVVDGHEQPRTQSRLKQRRRGVYPKGINGNGDFGNMLYAMKTTTSGILIMYITIRSNTGMLNE